MTPEEFRDAGHQLIDWIADYRNAVADAPVRAQVAPGDVRARFPDEAPLDPAPFGDVLQQLDSRVVPGLTQIQHPMHYGWFPSNATLSSVLGDIATSGIGSLGISWESCPALTEVEEVVCEWLRQLTGLSPAWRGAIHDTASSAMLVAAMVARERASGFSKLHGGLQAVDTPLVVYTTDQAHSSVAKAVQMAGFGDHNLRSVACDPVTRAMRADALADAIAEDTQAGRVPALVVASCGSTGVTAFDPVDAVADVTEAHGLWLHVDAAMAGSALLLPECRALFHGVERADSLSWNPHKWLGTVLDCSLLYVRDTDTLVRVLSTNPSYLQSQADGQVTQFRDWGIPLGRRFRALKLWFHLALDGVAAIQARLRRDLANAAWLAEAVDADPDWELVAPLTLQTVSVRHNPPELALSDAALDAHTLDWVERINASGEAFLSPATLDGRWFVRVSVGVESTEREHVEALWALLRRSAAG
ncbi:MAG: pyridoxal-dependent decarboxylase [Pseudomonadota bacterium]